jgi:pimeloyl-ACP methyl ester carboxylesterase
VRNKFVVICLLWCLGAVVSTAQVPTVINNTVIDCLSGMPTDEVIGKTALCGELNVPENWQNPDGRIIDIHYVILKAHSVSPFPDPVIFLEGGPGASSLVNVPFKAQIFDEIRRYRDVIIYDQRGTSFSTPLFCPSDIQNAPIADDIVLPELPTSDDPEIQSILDTANALSSFSTAINCRPYLEEQGFDLSQYRTSNSVLDLVAMMNEFDYESYNIYGISYGTNLALELFRYYEENKDMDLAALRSGIVDGVVPPNVDTRGGQAYISAYNVLRIFDDCEADTVCSEVFPNIRQRAIDLMLEVENTPLTIDDESIDFDQLRRVMVNSLSYKQDDVTGFAVGIGAQYLPLMIEELEQGVATTFIGLRDGTLPPEPEETTSSSPNSAFANIANETATLAGTARNLADEIEQLQLESQRASDALSSGLPLPQFFIQEFRIGLNNLDYLTATFIPASFDFVLANERTQENLANFAASIDPEIGSIVSLMTDADVDQAYRLLEDIQPTLDTTNAITLDVISCNDRYGSFDLESLFADFRSFEVPGFIRKTDVAVNAKVVCTLWGLNDDDTTLSSPVVTDLPILVANGSIDSETPVEWGESVYENLTNAYFVTFEYYPHGSTAQFSCGPAVAAAFILDPEQMPDTSCADDLQQSNFPFVTDETE